MAAETLKRPPSEEIDDYVFEEDPNIYAIGDRAAKRARLFEGNDDSESAASGGVELEDGGDFTINEEYAKRFEHNAKRAELHRRKKSQSSSCTAIANSKFAVEEKYGNSKRARWLKEKENGKRDEEVDSDESSSESEDDEGELATENLDAEISATLQAIRSKDPRVYDSSAKFYSEFGVDNTAQVDVKEEKPMYLRDYHRKNILEGNIGEEDDDDGDSDAPKTYAQEQREMSALVKQMHAAAEDDDGSDDEEEQFLVRKEMPAEESRIAKGAHTVPDVETADKDPETFLSNFMASRGWVPGESSKFQPFESDDEEYDARAEEFEQAYNMRFEDPKFSNEKLQTYSREATAKRTVRREELSGRKKIRERERERKEELKQEKEEEKARLRKLKIDEMEQRVKKIRQSAGMKGQDVDLAEWADVLEDDWDDEKWEGLMHARFGKGYYAEKDREPSWDDDIDIKDIVPDFEDEDDKPAFSLSEDEWADAPTGIIPFDSDEEADAPTGTVPMYSDDGEQVDTPTSSSKAKKKEHQRALQDKRRATKRDRRIIESLVDQNLDVDMAISRPSKKAKPDDTRPLFRYRDTSPTAFGLTPLEILTASDAQLNEFVGLKKLASFRDPERKRKDKKKLGKKGRLREWRKDVFGDANGDTSRKACGADMKIEANDDVQDGRVEKSGKKKKKRSRKSNKEREAAPQS